MDKARHDLCQDGTVELESRRQDRLTSSNPKIVSHGGIYLIGNVLRRMVSFIMLPIYTHYLTPEHYGTLELLSMVLDFAAIIFGMRIGEAVFRFYYQYEDARNRHEVISTSLIMVGLLNLLAVVILLVAAGPISAAMLGSAAGESAGRQLALFSFTLVFQSLTETVLTYIRAQQRPWLYVGISIVKLAVQLTLNIYFVVALRMAVDGVIYSALISSIVITAPLLWYAFRQTGLVFSREKARHMTSFSIPLIVTSMISFYMTFGDRYFLRVFGGGLAEVGVYSLGYRFGFLLSFIVGDPFFGIWNSEKYVTAKQPDAQARFHAAFLFLTVALVFVMTGISVFVRDFLRIMTGPEFWGAFLIVPLVMVGYVFQNWTSFANMGLLLHGRTRDIAVGTALSAALITVAYLALIPPFGGVGAAIATSLALGARLAWITMRAERLYPLRLPWARAAGMLGLGVATWGISLLAPERLWLSLALHTLLFTAFTAVLLFVPLLLPLQLRHELTLMLVRRLPARWRPARAVDGLAGAPGGAVG
jgi:O-antigen/teichoic acid export membrane protein